MKPETRQLIHDLLDPHRNTRRETALLVGGRILRRRRARRVALQGFTMVALLVLTAFTLQRLLPRQAPIQVAAPPPPAPPVEKLTDAQLLALFPNTPVGLVTLGDGRKRLIFPRPGDEERFLKRL